MVIKFFFSPEFDKVSNCKEVFYNCLSKELQTHSLETQILKITEEPKQVFLSKNSQTDKEAAIHVIDIDIANEAINSITRQSITNQAIVLLHDSKGRIITDKKKVKGLKLENFDGAIVGNTTIQKYYSEKLHIKQILTLKEAVDTKTFYPRPSITKNGELAVLLSEGDFKNSTISAISEISNIINKPLTIVYTGINPGFSDQAKASGLEVIECTTEKEKAIAISKFDIALVLDFCSIEEAEKEFIPNPVLEAWATGIPVISNFSIGSLYSSKEIPTLLAGTTSGKLENYINLLVKDKAYRGVFVQNGLRMANRSFTFWHRAKDLIDFCEKLDNTRNESQSYSASS